MRDSCLLKIIIIGCIHCKYLLVTVTVLMKYRIKKKSWL
jgi:hypothetical protein